MEDDSRAGSGSSTSRSAIRNRIAGYLMVDQLTYLITQGYELAEDEVNIKLDRFRLEYTNSDGSPK